MTGRSDDEGEEENDPDAEEGAAHASHEDLEVQIYNAVRWRLDYPEGMPGRETVFAMEEPIYRLVDAASLFCDLAFSAREYDPPKPRSLVSLAKTFRRETGRLYRLYVGKNPDWR